MSEMVYCVALCWLTGSRMADIHALFQGQQVQIWSNSKKSWEHGEVVQTWRGGPGEGILVQVQYGDPLRAKWLDAALVAKCLRLAPLKLNKAALGKSLLVQAMGPGLGGEEVAESGRRAERSC